MPAINKKLVKGGNLEISYHYTLLFNGFSFRGEYRLIEEIKKLNGVEDCYRAAEYELPEDAKPDGNPTKLSTSVGFINADDMWTLGYTRTGTDDRGLLTPESKLITRILQPHRRIRISMRQEFKACSTATISARRNAITAL